MVWGNVTQSHTGRAGERLWLEIAEILAGSNHAPRKFGACLGMCWKNGPMGLWAMGEPEGLRILS